MAFNAGGTAMRSEVRKRVIHQFEAKLKEHLPGYVRNRTVKFDGCRLYDRRLPAKVLFVFLHISRSWNRFTISVGCRDNVDDEVSEIPREQNSFRIPFHLWPPSERWDYWWGVGKDRQKKRQLTVEEELAKLQKSVAELETDEWMFDKPLEELLAEADEQVDDAVADLMSYGLPWLQQKEAESGD
jgi:hypothetical protein